MDGTCCTVPCAQQPQRFLAAFPRSPSQLLLRAQKDLWRGFEASLVGALSLLPVALLALARPFAVRPAPLLTGSFSPRPTDRFGNFFLGMGCYLYFAVFFAILLGCATNCLPAALPCLFALVVAAYSAELKDFIADSGRYRSPVLLEGLPDFVRHFWSPQSFSDCCGAFNLCNLHQQPCSV